MKLRGLLARLFALALVIAPVQAQDGQGTSPLSIPKGGTGANTAPGARTNLGLGSMATQNANGVAITGGAISGMANPLNPTDVANKSYVDAVATGLNILAPSALATAAVLPNTPTYANGASGVGATLTAGSNTTLTVDGTAAPLSTVVLVKNQASAFQNGIYTVTQAGSGAAPWILTRATYFDQAAEMRAGSYSFVTSGATNALSAWTLQAAVATVGTDPLNFVLFSSVGGVVTSVTCNSGLLGGTFTGAGTCSLDLSRSSPFGGRLTLVSGQPEITTDVVGAQNVYYAPITGQGVPIYNGSTLASYQFTSGPTDQVGLTLALAGSANWAAGSIHDAFACLNGGVPVLCTRAWDAGMQPTANSLLTPSTLIVTGTTPNGWTRASAAFDGTVSKATASSAVLVTSNTNQDGNCLGQDWGAGTPKVLSQVLVTAPTDEFLLHSGPASLQVTTYGSNDNANWQILDVRTVNASTIGLGGTATISVNASYTTPYRYDRFCVRGDGVNNVNIAQIRFYASLPPSAGRRLQRYGGFLTNDAVITARINATTTISVPQNQATYLGTIGIDAASPGQVSAYVNPGPSRVYNIWNMYNQIDIAVVAVVNTLAATGVQGYVYTLASNTNWTSIQSSTFNIGVLIGYAQSPVLADLMRGAFFNSAGGNASGYAAGIAVDTVAAGFSGTECSLTNDGTGVQVGLQCRADLTLPAFYGTHVLTAIESLGVSAGSVSLFTDLRNTRMQAKWRG